MSSTLRSAPRQAWRATSHDGAGEPIAGRAVVYLDDVRVFQGVDSALPQLAQFVDNVEASIAGGRRRQGAGEEGARGARAVEQSVDGVARRPRSRPHQAVLQAVSPDGDNPNARPRLRDLELLRVEHAPFDDIPLTWQPRPAGLSDHGDDRIEELPVRRRHQATDVLEHHNLGSGRPHEAQYMQDDNAIGVEETWAAEYRARRDSSYETHTLSPTETVNSLVSSKTCELAPSSAEAVLAQIILSDAMSRK